MKITIVLLLVGIVLLVGCIDESDNLIIKPFNETWCPVNSSTLFQYSEEILYVPSEEEYYRKCNVTQLKPEKYCRNITISQPIMTLPNGTEIRVTRIGESLSIDFRDIGNNIINLEFYNKACESNGTLINSTIIEREIFFVLNQTPVYPDNVTISIHYEKED